MPDPFNLSASNPFAPKLSSREQNEAQTTFTNEDFLANLGLDWVCPCHCGEDSNEVLVSEELFTKAIGDKPGRFQGDWGHREGGDGEAIRGCEQGIIYVGPEGQPLAALPVHFSSSSGPQKRYSL